jgi:FAD:protein FMN transferase
MGRTSRRRVITITAASACLGLNAPRAEPVRRRWEGSALGAGASLTLYHPDPSRAARLIRQALAEIERLERIFSLQRADSEINRLNRDWRLRRPSLDLMAVLEGAARVWHLSEGTFDPTVQPLWRLLAGTSQPSPKSVERAAALIGWDRVGVARSEAALPTPGMAITLNGIAQGYITDRIATMLRDGGLDHALVGCGELRALGERPDGRPWRLGTALGPMALADGALAISGPTGDPVHLIDPRRGRPVAAPPLVAVTAPTAMLADGLSTALAAADADTQDRIAAKLPTASARLWSLRAA